MTCDTCGAEIADDCDFCPRCGAQLNAAPSQPVPEQQLPAPYGYCRNCGTPFASSQASVCLSCGVARGTGSAYCPSCGKPTNPGSAVCLGCGAAVGPLAPTAPGGAERKSKIAAGLLAIFLGGLGIHKFYLGFTGPGVVYVCVSLLAGVVTLGIAAVVMGIIALIEGIIYLTKSDEEFYQLYEVQKKQWF